MFSLGRVSNFPRRLPVKAWVAEGGAGARAALDTARGVCRQQEQQTHWLVIKQTGRFRTADSTILAAGLSAIARFDPAGPLEMIVVCRLAHLKGLMDHARSQCNI